MTPRLSGQNCNFLLLFFLSLDSQKKLGYKENNTEYRVCPERCARKARGHVRVLIYWTWPIEYAQEPSWYALFRALFAQNKGLGYSEYTRAANMPEAQGRTSNKLINVLLMAVYNWALKHNFGIDIKLLRWLSANCLSFFNICPLAEQMLSLL